jgi:hypothetical protein
MTLCIVKITFQDKQTSRQSIWTQKLDLDLDDSVENQIYDYFERQWSKQNVVDFKWSDDMSSFSTAIATKA